MPVRTLLGVKPGTTAWNVLRQLGQPDRRLGNAFRYCGQGDSVKIFFKDGRVTGAKRI